MTEREWIYQGKIISLSCDDGYDIVHHPGAVVMIPVTADGNLLFVSQFRQAAQKTILELPAGTLEEGEPPLDCAIRELQEEVGYFPNKVTSLGGFYTAPGFCTEYLHLYLCEALKKSSLIAEDTDEIEVHSLSLEQALKYIEDGTIVDVKTIAGIYRYEKTLT